MDSPAPPPHHAWLKLAILVLVVAALGLPINDLVRYAMLTIAAVLIVAGEVTARAPRWLAALVAVRLCVAGQILLTITLDHYGAFGLTPHPVSLSRLLGAAFRVAHMISAAAQSAF